MDTDDGPENVTVGPDTVIQKSAAGTLEDLEQGVRIAPFGSSEETGGEASFVLLILEGAEGNFGGGFFFGERRIRQGNGPSP